jgi:DNA-binding NarL/FixJ family response regulator
VLVKILVADDHSLFRDGLVGLLEAAGFSVIGQVGDGQAAVEMALRLRPDIVLLDTTMPELTGLEALRQLRAEWPAATVVLLTSAEEDHELFEAVEAGARGYLSKSLRADEFIAMLKGLARGEAAMTRQTTGRLLGAFSRSARRAEPNSLTEREVELLRLMVEGRSNKDIAHALALSENTVKYHIKNILQKLDVHNRTEAAAHAVRAGLVRPNGVPHPTN